MSDITGREWQDDARFPGETESGAMLRRVKMHEFVMGGGIVVGTQAGIVIYSDPVDPAVTPVCPWHGEGCTAWTEILEGRGTGTIDGPTLRELRSMTDQERWEAKKAEQIERIAKGYDMPRAQAKIEGDKLDAQVAAERRAAQQAAEAQRAAVREAMTFETIPDTIEVEGPEDEEEIVPGVVYNTTTGEVSETGAKS